MALSNSQILHSRGGRFGESNIMILVWNEPFFQKKSKKSRALIKNSTSKKTKKVHIYWTKLQNKSIFEVKIKYIKKNLKKCVLFSLFFGVKFDSCWFELNSQWCFAVNWTI